MSLFVFVEDSRSPVPKKHQNGVIIKVPGYNIRKDISTSDPAAVMEASNINIRFILPRMFGHRFVLYAHIVLHQNIHVQTNLGTISNLGAA